MLDDAYTYTVSGIVGNRKKWIWLIVATILLTLPLIGYLMKVFRGEKPAPEVDNWERMIIDGSSLAIIMLIYSIPLIIVYVFLRVQDMRAMFNMGTMTGAVYLGVIVMLVMYIILWITLPIVQIRFARNGIFGNAFNFGVIPEKIGKIGWVEYIIALIILAVVVGVPVIILELILFAIFAVMTTALSYTGACIGILIAIIAALIIIPLIAVFEARYLTLVFDSVP